MRSPLFTAWLLAILAVAVTAAAPAEAYNRKAAKARDAGVSAAKAGDWAAAREAFEEALSISDKEGRSRVGVKFYDYYPSLGLAEAAIELGDFDAARSALERFDRIKKPGGDQSATAAALRSRLGGGTPAATPDRASGPAPEAVAARRALDAGDLAGARRHARSAPTDKQAQEVLAAVDALLAETLTAARRDQEAGALSSAQEKLAAVLDADPDNSAARSLVEAVRADAASARSRLSDARAALDARRFEEAENLARQARTRDSSLAEESGVLESRISEARRAPQPRAGEAPSSRRADAVALLNGARSDLDAGRLAEARRKASDALVADPARRAEVEAVRAAITDRAGGADDALRRGRAAVGGGRFVEARQLAGQAQVLDRGLKSEAGAVLSGADEGEAEAGLLLAKIEAHVESGASDSARKVVAELAAAFPEHPELAAIRAAVEGSGELVVGLRAYFRGDWAASIETLTPLVASHAERSDLLAVLGCAHATRGLLKGEEAGKGDIERARELFQDALAAEPSMELDARYFSPRLREIFASVRGG